MPNRGGWYPGKYLGQIVNNIFGPRTPTTTPPPWEPLEFDVPGFGADSSQEALDVLGGQISELEEQLLQENLPENYEDQQVYDVQENIDRLSDVYAQMETSLIDVTTPPPPAEVLFGDDPEMLDLYNTQGTVTSSLSPTGSITIDPQKFQDDVNNFRLISMPVRDYDPATGQSFQDFNNTALRYDNPATAQEEAWNLAQSTPAYQQAMLDEGYVPEIQGDQGTGEGGEFQDRYMTMLENLMTMIAQPQGGSAQPRFISREEASGEIEPLKAEAGFQQSGLSANDLLGMLTSFGQQAGG